MSFVEAAFRIYQRRGAHASFASDRFPGKEDTERRGDFSIGIKPRSFRRGDRLVNPGARAMSCAQRTQIEGGKNLFKQLAGADARRGIRRKPPCAQEKSCFLTRFQSKDACSWIRGVANCSTPGLQHTRQSTTPQLCFWHRSGTRPVNSTCWHVGYLSVKEEMLACLRERYGETQTRLQDQEFFF